MCETSSKQGLFNRRHAKAVGTTSQPICHMCCLVSRYFVPNPAYKRAGCCSWFSTPAVPPAQPVNSQHFSQKDVQLASPRSGAKLGPYATENNKPWQGVQHSSRNARRRTTSNGGRQQQHDSCSSGKLYAGGPDYGSSHHNGARAVRRSSDSSDGNTCFDGGSSASSSSSIHVSIMVPRSAGGAAAAGGGVPKELELLKGVSGFAVPGNLMALMGGSGAGEGVWQLAGGAADQQRGCAL